MSALRYIRPDLRELRPYSAAEQVDDTIRLNANEAPWTNTDNDYRRPLNRYPEVRPAKLQALLARFYACPAENLVVTRGSSEAIDLLIRIFCQANQDSILTVAPTFSMYRHYARIQGAKLIEQTTAAEQNFAADVDQLLANCDDTVRLIFLCSPNNPTGNSISESDLLRLLEARKRAAVVVDEAYVEFSSQPSVTRLIEQFDNLIVLRTLSKALACAGARCGSVIASAEIASVIAAVQAPYALATPVVECVENALLDDGFERAERWATKIVAQREHLMQRTGELSFVEQVWPSDANFFLCRVGDAAALIAYCTEQGVLLRDFGTDLANCIRITIGSETENQRLLQVLAGYAELKQ